MNTSKKEAMQTQELLAFFCFNTPQKPDDRCIEQILHKVASKNEQMEKIITLLEKYASKAVRDQKSNNMSEQDNTFTVMKTGTVIMNCLRKLPKQIYEDSLSSLNKMSTLVICRKPANYFLTILYKIIAFKLSLQSKFPLLCCNFHLRPEQSLLLTPQSLEYLSQYCLKLLTYLTPVGQPPKTGTVQECEVAVVQSICEEVYDALSTLLFCLMSMKKDSQLRIAGREKINAGIFTKLDAGCEQILALIGRLCGVGSMFEASSIYSVCCDYFEYKEELCLIYHPLITSYEYFYVDQNRYKGLAIPEDYGKYYGQGSSVGFGEFQLSPAYQDRKVYPNRANSFKAVQKEKTTSGKTNQKTSPISDFDFDFNKSKLDTSKDNTLLKNSQTLKKLTPKTQSNQFDDFITSIKANKPKNVPSSSSRSPRQQSSELVDLQAGEHELMSYEWLKKTEKIKHKMFEKPEVDPIIYVLYEQICKSMKLPELKKLLAISKKYIVDPNQVLFQKVIGSGSAGEVYIGKYKEQVAAIKKVKIESNPNALKQFEREVLTYLKIKSHACLVSLIGLTKYNSDYFLLTEFCEGGSLFDLLHKRVNEVGLSWSQRLGIALDIARGMEFLHYMNPPVIHRDLKSLNVFMTQAKGRWQAKVADFGLSRSPESEMMTAGLGTLHWMAPQLLANKQYSLKVDVYSFGVVLWEICSRRTPYHNITNQMGIVKHVVMEKGRPQLELLHPGCPKQLTGLMVRCWSEEPGDRPQFPQVVTMLNKIKM